MADGSGGEGDRDEYMDDVIVQSMLMEMDPCISTNELRIFVGTWNEAGRSPVGSLAVDLDEWLNLRDAADVYVIGFQEIVPLKARTVIGIEDPTEATNWNQLIGKTLNDKDGCPALTPMLNPTVSDSYHYARGQPTVQHEEPNQCSRYKLMASKKMVGVFISVWMKRELLKSYCISSVKVCSVACGIMGYLGWAEIWRLKCLREMVMEVLRQFLMYKIEQVSLVINYDIPNNRELYIHRIGRSDRFGCKRTAGLLLLLPIATFAATCRLSLSLIPSDYFAACFFSKSEIDFDPENWLADSSCEWQVECHTRFPCAIKGHRVSGGIRAAVVQETVASAKKILWDSLLRKTMANTKERIDALEAQIHDMFKSDQDAPGILKQFSLRLDALEVNLEATDNTRYAESMEWEGKFQELQDRVEHHARHSGGIDWESKFQELQDRVELLSRAVVNTPAGGAEHSSRPRVPEPKSYGGARDAKELENFLFDVEQYFRAIRVDSEATKVSMAAMYLVGDAKLWWRKKYAEIEDGSCVINTWEILKREIKSQFFPENTAFNARKALLECKHTGSVREYCQAFSALMLDISDMSAVDRLFFFMEGLKPWARTELNRRRVNNLNEAIIAAESLSDYNPEPQRPPQRGNPSRGIGGKKPGGPMPNQSWGSKSSWASNSSTQQKSGVGFKAKPDASTSGEVKKPPFRGCFLCQGPHVIANCPQRQMMNAFFDNIGQVQRGEQSGSRPRHPPTDEQTDTQDYEEEDAVGAFPQWCNAVTTQVGNPKKSSTGEEPKDMPPKKKGDVPGKGLMYVDIKVNGKAIRAMVDTGATHNYISSTEVERLGLTLEKGCGRVKAINSAAQPVAGIARSVLIKIGPYEGRTNFSVVIMDDFKLILGLEFLRDTKTTVMPYASDFALGGVLMQEGHPVAYESRKLNEAERRYTTHEKELLAVVHCLRIWRHYLLGSSFIVRTDNTAVSHFLSQSKLTSKQARWQELLAEFNFMLEYRTGSTNSVADALSRRAELDQVALMAMNAIVRADSRVAINIGKKIKKALTRDPVAQQLLKLIESAEDTAQLFFKYVVKYWGMPQDIVSDRDSRFTGNFWTELFKLFGSQLSMSSSYHPESDGQTERFNSMLEEYLRHFVSATQKNWVKLLDVAQLCFNSRKSSSTGKSAFEIVNGQQPLLPHTVNVPNAGKSPRAISFSEEWRQNIDLAHSYLEKAARRMKKHADKNRRSQEFNVGDKVMVKLLQQDRKFLRGRDSRLLQKYEGPLTIVKKIGKMAYKVDPPHWWSRQLHPVFHVSMLKPFYEDTADPSRGQIKRQGLKPKAAGKRVAEAILNDRVIIASRKRHQEYLVKWQGQMDEENTWERAADLSAYADKIEAYHMQKLTRASTALVGENVTGCPLHPPSTAPPRPSSSAPPRPSNRRPCARTSSSKRGTWDSEFVGHIRNPWNEWVVDEAGNGLTRVLVYLEHARKHLLAYTFKLWHVLVKISTSRVILSPTIFKEFEPDHTITNRCWFVSDVARFPHLFPTVSGVGKVTTRPLEARSFPSLSNGLTCPWPGKETRKTCERASHLCEPIFFLKVEDSYG
ncbi:hypothetical protein RJ639_019881 [Escallonia herrerae]|uniref:Reverse transcriptase n=1 Tax=Escallonia herrerae TaxID=1293975 RepID=A0AA89AK89_9ASTE|nr:hypothetical protein RJ639_019881 [Escallonia herrerae]